MTVEASRAGAVEDGTSTFRSSPDNRPSSRPGSAGHSTIGAPERSTRPRARRPGPRVLGTSRHCRRRAAVLRSVHSVCRGEATREPARLTRGDGEMTMKIDEGDVTRQAFQLHLPGLLKVLAEHLYTNKSVGVRELLQNAHDSCVRRSVEERFPGYRPRIDVAIDRAHGVLTIDDNGSGLTREDVVDYLSTIGKSYTRDLKEQLALLSPDEAATLIGQFGLGFLSAFLLASEVTVQTRSHRHGHRPVRWHCTGDEEYELTAGTRTEPGTTVIL